MIKQLKYKDIEVQMEVESQFEQSRFSTWLTKEPETIDWIEKFFSKGDIFFDLGANIGVYSLFAKALHKDNIEVYAFEPVYHNFSKLCKNAIANKFLTGFHVFPVAISDSTRLESIKLASDISGSAMHVMEGSVEERHDFQNIFSQGVASFSLDDLVERFALPVPSHIKIDTDGLEEKIIAGGDKILSDKRLKSVLVEISPKDPSGERILKIMKKHGFNTDHPINNQENHSRKRRQESGNNFENIIFTQ